MEGEFHGLPPVKRFRLMQQSSAEKQLQREDSVSVSLLRLPAKKRKESRDPPYFLPNPTSTTFCLPAKKRVWALQPDVVTGDPISPFDLNVEPKKKGREKESREESDTPDSNANFLFSENVTDERSRSHLCEEDDEDDGILCAVCRSTDGDPSDPIVFCDGCDLMVHVSCYGYPLIEGVPEGDWFCAQCLTSQSSKKDAQAFSCCLCPVKDGAMKPTNDGNWAHIVCALLVPEVYFKDPVGREGIDCSKVPTRRWRQECFICDSACGCAIDCSEPKCPLSFHITCGLNKDLCIEYREGRNKAAIVVGFCKSHTDLWKKQEQTGKFKIVARH